MIAGAKKQYYHKIAPSKEQFAELLLELYKKVKPDLTIVDAVVGMQGEGPSAGQPRRTELILASKNAIAVDLVACDIMKFKRNSVITNKLALKKKLFKAKIQIIGKKHKIPYKAPSEHEAGFLFKLISRLLPSSKITVHKNTCIKCHSCEKRCPVKAIILKPYPVVDTKKCIRCFCCIEVCPTHALYLKEHFITKNNYSYKKKNNKNINYS